MAKYTITMSCGHEDTVELFGKTSERERKIEYFKESGLCKECYKKKMAELTKTQGLIFNASALPYIDDDNGSILLSVWFSGDTMPYKDKIKALGGYRWGERDSASDFYTFSRPVLCWHKTIKIEDIENEIEKATTIGAKSVALKENIYEVINYQIALDAQKKWKEKNEKIAKIAKPQAPTILKGHKWNQKIYGRSGNYSIYPDGEKVSITDEQAEEIKSYLEAKEEYRKKISEID